ncbi:MAG: aldo/keto reductase family protein [Acidimicrobiia bacterium]
MRYRNVGRWGLKVSAVGLGSWLTYGGSVEAGTAKACIWRAYDRGVTLFDTANVYMRGAAETVMGGALSEFRRDSYVLATKVFFPMSDGPHDSGLSRKHVTEQCHASLQRLGTEYIDLYQCHRYDTATPLEETCRAMDDLIRRGDVLYWGTSEWSADQIAHAVDLCRRAGWSEPVSNQPQYSALTRRIERRVLPTCVEYGLGTVVFSPLAQGVLTGKYRSGAAIPSGSRAAGGDAAWMRAFLEPEVLDAVARLHEVASVAGCTVAQLALAWCLRLDAVSSVIVGATDPDHVDDNVAAADLDLPRDIFAEVEETLESVAST